MDEKTLTDFADQVGAAALRLPKAPRGRQNDVGASLQSAGVLIIPLFTDPGVPGAVYSADLVELKQGRLGVHRVETLRDGEVGTSANVSPSGGPVGDLKEILSLLAGNLAPGVLPSVLAGGDPLSLLAALVAKMRAKRQ